jgi:Rieske 2Fe-2S family protein
MTLTSEVLALELLDPAGIDPVGLDRALAPFGRSRMLPAAAYTSPSVLAWEQRHLFAGTWTCVGRESVFRARSGRSGPPVARSSSATAGAADLAGRAGACVGQHVQTTAAT